MPDIFDTIEAPTTSAGGDIFDTIPETIAPIKRENARRLFDPAFKNEVTPILTELETQARQGGVFGAAPAGSFLDLNNTLDKFVTPEEGSEGPVLAAKRKYAETRDAFANTFDLTPDEADDFVKHRAGLQTAGVSKDTFGQIHIKDETLAKPIDEIRKEISASNLPDDVKAKYTAEDSPELDLKVAGFKANTVASVVKNHPELAAEIGITGDEKQLDQDFAKLTKELNASVSEQLVSGVGPGLSRSVSELEHIGGLFEDKLDFSDKVPYLEQRSREIERRQKYRESLNQLSSQLNESKTQLFGTDAATIGGGLYSAAESVAITALTGPAAAELVPARLLGGAVKAAVAVQPVSALYATRQASDTYEQAIEAGKTPEEAQELAAKAFGIEWGFTTAFSAAGAGGLEDIGTKLGQEAVKKSFKGATGEILKTTLGENAEEGLINLFQTVAVDAKLNPHLTEDDLKKRAYDTFVATTLATGPISVAAETLKPTHEQTTEELHDTADKIYSEKVLSETEDQGGDVEAPSKPSVVTRAELEAERNKRIGELTDPEEIAALKDVDLDELAEDWGVELKQDETFDTTTAIESPSIDEAEESVENIPLPPTEMTERAKAPGEKINPAEIQNDNQQPTATPQLEVPVPPVSGAELGTDTSSEGIAPKVEAADELPPVAEPEAAPATLVRGQPINITLEDGSTETGRIVGIVPDGTYNVAGPSGIIMNKKAGELSPIENEQNIPKPQEVLSVPVPKVPTGTTPQQDTKPDSSNAKTTETAKKEIEAPLKDEISAPEDFISALAEAMGLAGRVTVTNKGKGELQQGKKGAVDFKGTASALISLFKSADQSTAVHEMSHVARRFLFNRDIAPENRLGISDADITAAEEFSGAKDGVWNRAAEEKFARGFERYVRDGKFPSDKKVEVLFSKLAKWLQSIYKVVAGSSLDIELSDEIREVFDNLITRGQIIPAPAKPATAPATAKPKRKLPPRTAPPKTTSVKNAETDKELEALGLSPVYDPGKKALQETWDESLAVVSKDRFAGKKLVQELLEKPRSISDVEHGVLLDELAKSKLRAAKAQEELFAAQKAGVKVNDVQKELETARQDIIRVVKASKLAGTEWGRAGRFRQIRIEEDYTIEAMQAHYQAVVNDGAPLTKADEKFIAELQAKIVAAENAVKVLQEEVGEQARTVAGLLKKLAERAKVRAPSKARTGQFTENLKSRAESALDRLKERGIGRLFQEEESLNQDEETPQRDPSIIDDLGIVGATWLQEGVREFDAFTEKLVKEFGEDFREVAKQVFEVAQIEFKESATKARAKTPQELMNLLDPENPKLSNKLIYNMVRGFINQGLEGPKVLDAVTKLLQEEFPDITREDVAIAFTQYGKVKFPSQEEDLKKARELRELERIQLQIDDINAGRAPKKTGQQRDKPSVDIRELQKQRNELLKALNIKAVQKTQLRSSLDAVKTRLRNEIEELNHAIATKVAQVKRKPSPASDAEVLALKAKRDQVKDHYNAVFGINKKAVTDQQRLNTALKGLNKRIAEERALTAKGLAERTKNGKPISNAQVDALRKTLNALVKQRQQLRAALHPKQSIEEREMKRAETAATRAIKAYQNPTTKGKLHLTPSKELALLWELRDSLKAAAEAARKQARSLTRKSPEAIAYAARLKALEKSVADLEARVKRGDLSTKGKKLGPETLAVTELKKRQKAAQDALDALRAALDTRTPEERRDAALVRAANTRRQKIEARIKANDYVKVAPVPRVKSAALIKALHDEALAKAEWNEKFFAAELAKRSKWEKSRDAIGEVVNVSRTMMTMADVSAVFRQGGLGFLAHPILGARSIPGMINSGLSEAKALSRYHALQARPNAALAQEAKLFIAKMGPNVSLTEMEEAFRGRVAKKIPGIKQVANFSERTYADFLNHLRMDMFDAMVAGLPSVGGRVTTAEAKVIADYINKSTGRGNLGDSENAAATLAAVFFSPKFVASRFQWLWGIVPTAFNVATGFTLVPKDVRRAKKAIAKEYTRTFIGIAAVYTLSALAKAAWGDDDDKWEFDPRSSAAGKIKVGPNTFVDPMAGLLQASTFGSRMLPTMHKGKWGVYTKGPKGVTSLTNAGFGKTGYADVAWTFTRSKFSPAVGTWINMGTGQDLGRNKVTPQSEVLGAFVPLIFGEVYETMKENGAAKGVPLALLSTFGVGVRNQTKATTLEQDVLKKLGDTTDYTKKASGGGEKKLIIR